MKNHSFLLLLTMAVFLLASDCPKDDEMQPCYDISSNISIEVKTVDRQNADNCEPGEPPCPHFCPENIVPCKVEVYGVTQGLVGENCVHMYIWVKTADGIYHRKATKVALGNNGAWTENVQLGEDAQLPIVGEKYEILVTLSADEIDIPTTKNLSDPNLNIDYISESAIIEIVSCFDPNKVDNFRITHVDNILVSNDRVDNVDCSSVGSGNPCQIEVDGESSGIYDQRDCSYIVVLIEPDGTNLWYKQDDLAEVSPNGAWNTSIQLGDVTPASDPRGKTFTITAVVTSIPFDSIPVLFLNNATTFNAIFTPATSVSTNNVRVKVKP